MKRFWMDTETYDGSSHWAHPVKDSGGEWVRYEEAQAENARLTAEVQRTNDVLESQAHVIRDLRAKLDTAHNDAIEAAVNELKDTAKNWDCGHPESRLCNCEPLIEQWEFAADVVRDIKRPQEPRA